ncbi:MAG: ABC transporter permease [Rubrobacteraceae bacterium]
MVEQIRGGSQAVTASEEQAKIKGRTQREIFWRQFKRHKLALISGVVLIFLYIVALLTPYVAPYGFAEIDFLALANGPTLVHPMGTDELGRDELTRVLYGGRVSLLLGLGVGVFSTVIGAVIGILAGFYGRFVDLGLMGFTDYVLTLPFLALLLVLGSIFQFDAVTITVLLAALLWPQIARIVRGQVLTVREQEYVIAARAIGVSGARIMVRHILPNVVGAMVVQATLTVGIAILAESVLSFLGLGIQPPTPSWGNLLSDAQTNMVQDWWLAVFPGIMIVITVLCVNFLGDGLRDALDPKSVE